MHGALEHLVLVLAGSRLGCSWVYKWIPKDSRLGPVQQEQGDGAKKENDNDERDETTTRGLVYKSSRDQLQQKSSKRVFS